MSNVTLWKPSSATFTRTMRHLQEGKLSVCWTFHLKSTTWAALNLRKGPCRFIKTRFSFILTTFFSIYFFNAAWAFLLSRDFVSCLLFSFLCWDFLFFFSIITHKKTWERKIEKKQIIIFLFALSANYLLIQVEKRKSYILGTDGLRLLYVMATTKLTSPFCHIGLYMVVPR